jgi:hypothetical protein
MAECPHLHGGRCMEAARAVVFGLLAEMERN